MRDLNFDHQASQHNAFEPVQVAELDDKSVLCIDFAQSTATNKSLLDLEEASTVTKSIEPFFLDAENGKLYSWEGKANRSILS